MSECRPRDLTAEELGIANAPAGRGGESMPSRVPPGMQTPIEQLGAGAETPGSTLATQARAQSEPREIVPPSSVGLKTASAPTQGPPRN
jgi:hypothetical protein